MFNILSKFPLAFQIKVRLFIITLFVNFLVLLLFFINSYIIFNKSYQNTVSALDNAENFYLDEVMNYFSLQHHILINTAKSSNVQLRRFIDLYLNNKKFLEQLNNLKSDGVEHVSFGEEDENVKKAIDNAYEYIKSINDRTFDQDLEHSMIDGIVLGYKNSLFYYHTNTERNQSYDKETFEKEKHKYSKYSLENYFNITRIFNKVLNQTSILSSIEQNPIAYVPHSDSSINLPYNYEKDNDDITHIIDLFSVKFTPQSSEKITNSSSIPIDNFIYFSINSQFIKKFLPILEFNGLSLSSTLLTGKLLYNLPCYYLMKRYNLQNDIDTPIEAKGEISNIKECILYEDAKEQFETFFNSSYLPRKAKLKLLSIGSVLNKASKIFGQGSTNFSWKIIRTILPSIDNNVSFYSPFNINYIFNGYLFKDVTDTANQRDNLYTKSFMTIALVIAYCAFLWIIILAVILIISIKKVNDIFNPIFKLKNAVNSFNSTNNKEAIETLRSLRYKDDKDIDDLFISCKRMLLGGFRDEDLEDGVRHQKISEYDKAINRVYNSISIIKSNNLIILNEEAFMKNTNNIFSYDANDNLSVRGSRKVKSQKIHCKLSIVGNFEQEDEIVDEDEMKIKEIVSLCEEEEKNNKAKTVLENVFDEVMGEEEI